MAGDQSGSVVHVQSAGVALDEFRKARLEYLKDRQRSCQAYNSEMSKWILASLLLLNAGPFAALVNDNVAYDLALAANAQYFVAALALALTCGFMAWLNTGMREVAASCEVDQILSTDSEVIAQKGTAKGRSLVFVRFGFVAAVLTGFGSLVSFSLGAYHLTADFQDNQAHTSKPADISGRTSAR